MSDRPAWLASLLQVTDSAFPTGGYAHSAGFEQIVQLGLVLDEATMAAYLRDHVWPALIHFELPIVRLSREAALSDDVAELLALDEMVDAAKGARELREASRALGCRRLATQRGIGLAAIPPDFARRIAENLTPGHHAVVFGAALAVVPETALLTAWSFQALSSLCLTAPKLLRMGQDAVQRVLAAALATEEANIEISRAVTRDDLGWFDPAVEIASMRHEIAHERLFIS